MAKIIQYDEVTSTNDVANELAIKGAAHFTCVASLKQTAGRGRRGRVWRTIPNKSVAATFILREGVNHTLPLVASLAVYDVITSYVPCHIKWPNDILLNHQKVCGVLAERIQNDGDPFYLLGIGINVKAFDASELEGIIGTSIEAEANTSVEINEVLDKLVHALKYRIEQDTGSLMNDYRSYCYTLGKDVKWQLEDKTLQGQAIRITDYGSLILKVDDKEHEITSGDIIAQGDIK